jgi:hypothetical protein
MRFRSSIVAIRFSGAPLLQPNDKLTCWGGMKRPAPPKNASCRPSQVQRLDTHHGLEGMGWPLVPSCSGINANLVPAWDFQPVRAGNHDAGSARQPNPRDHDALLFATAPILMRHRPPRQNHLRLRPRCELTQCCQRSSCFQSFRRCEERSAEKPVPVRRAPIGSRGHLRVSRRVPRGR